MILSLLFAVCCLLLLSGLVVFVAARRAPYGEETEAGFHFDPAHSPSESRAASLRPSATQESRPLGPKLQYPAA